MLNQSNRICFRRFYTDRFERLQKRTHRGGLSVWSFIMCHGPGALITFDGCLNSLKYIDLLEEHLPTALEEFPNIQLNHIIYQQDNAQSHLSKVTQDSFKKNNIKQLTCLTNSPYLNIIENLWSIIDNKLLKLSINNLDDLKKGIQNA